MGFPATRNSVLVSLQAGSQAEQEDARQLLMRTYWEPVYRQLRLKWRKDPDAASDLTQEFFALLLEQESLASYDRTRGRFRTYLKGCLDRFVSSSDRAERRLKRGGPRPQMFDIDAVEEELSGREPTPEEQLDEEFDRAVAASILESGVHDLRELLSNKGKDVYYEVFTRYALVDDDERPSYSAVARQLGVKETDVTNYLAYARREFRNIVLGHLRRITANEEEFELEASAVLGWGGGA